MKILFVVILALGCFKVFAFNFYQEYSINSEIINGVKYPQNRQTLYSGTGNSSYSLPRAIRGMLGFDEADYYSYTARKVMKYLVKGRIKPDSKLVDYTVYADLIKATERNSMLVQLVQNYLSSSKPISTSVEREGALAEIMDDYFSNIGRQNVQENFVSYIRKVKVNGRDVEVTNVHNNRILWPSETVYSSVHQFVSMLYGQNIVIFNEKDDPRSVDMGFWNFKKNGYWYESHKDVGEFVAGGLLPAKVVTGFQLREVTGHIYIKSRMKMVPVHNQISYAFYKERVDNEDVVVVVKNDSLSGCMKRTAPFKYSFCRHSYSVDTMNEILVKPSKIKKQLKKCRKKAEGSKRQNCLEKLDRLISKMTQNPNKPAVLLNKRVPVVGYFAKIDSSFDSLNDQLSRRVPLARLTADELKWLGKKVIKKAWLVDKIKFVPIK